MNEFEELNSLIFDLGTFKYRIGISGMDYPSYELLPFLGINDSNCLFYSREEISHYSSTANKQDIKILNFMSKETGCIDNFELFDEFIDHFISNTHLLPEMPKCPFLFSEPSIHYKNNRIKLTQLMFEKYQIPSLFIGKSATLSSFSIGRTTCIIFDSGHSFTSSVPVHDGLTLSKAIIQNDIAGKVLNKEIITTLKLNNNLYSTMEIDESFKEFQIANYVDGFKRDLIAEENENKNNIEYILPDGNKINVDKDNLMNSIYDKMFGQGEYSKIVFDSVFKVEQDIKKELFNNIFICGGNTLLCRDLGERIKQFIVKRVSQTTIVKVTVHPMTVERTLSVWLGASILTSLGSFKEYCVKKEDFEENGANVIERRCA